MIHHLFSQIRHRASRALVVLAFVAASTALPARADIYSMPLGLVGSAPSVKGTALGIDVRDTTAYLGDWGGGTGNFQTYSVVDPTNPVRLSAQDTPSDEIGDLVVEGARAFVANDALGLSVFDVTDPSAPVLSARRNAGVYAHSVTIATLPTTGGPRLYALVGHIYGGGLALYDVTSPGPLPVPTIYSPGVRDVYDTQVAGSTAYVVVGDGSGNNRLDVVDLSPLPAPPIRVGSVALPMNALGFIGQTRVLGSYLVCPAAQDTSHAGGLRIIDVSNPVAPTLAGGVDVANVGSIPWKGAGGDVANGRAYLATTAGLAVFDLSAPTTPSLLATYAWPASFGALYGGHVQVVGPLAYVAAYGVYPAPTGGLAIFKVAPMAPPVRAVRIDIQPGGGVGCLNMNQHGAIPVAIFGEPTLDVTQIDVLSLQLQGLSVKIVGKAQRALASITDVDMDGIPDLMVQFADSDDWVAPGSGQAELTGNLTNGQAIGGQDAICVVQ